MKTTGYKWIKDDMKSDNGNCKWELGKWKKHKGKLELCGSGFHACKTPLQSLRYIYGNKWFMVEARGNIIHEKGDKFVASEMRIIKEIPPKKVLIKFAIMCARRCLNNFEKENPKDKRPRKAIEAAEAFYKNPTEKNRSAARSAWSAARSAESAARSAWSAARSARSAWSAAWSAELAARSAESAARSAWSAARSAESAAWSARSAWSAAWSAGSGEVKWQEKTLKALIKKHAGKKDLEIKS